jgi:hypothetical protein
MFLGCSRWNPRQRRAIERPRDHHSRWLCFAAVAIALAGCERRLVRGIRQAGRELMGVHGADESDLEKKVRRGSERIEDGHPIKDYGRYWNSRDVLDRQKWENQPVPDSEPPPARLTDSIYSDPDALWEREFNTPTGSTSSDTNQ